MIKPCGKHLPCTEYCEAEYDLSACWRFKSYLLRLLSKEVVNYGSHLEKSSPGDLHCPCCTTRSFFLQPDSKFFRSNCSCKQRSSGAGIPAESEDLAGSAAPSDESWKAAFEKSLWENYNVTPEYYEDLGDGVYQVYVKIDGKTVPYVCVDSATGDYHG